MYDSRMPSPWAFRKPIPHLGFAAALLSVMVAVPVAGCSGFQLDSDTTTVRGVVLDSVTKKPVAHATVYFDREPPPPPDAPGPLNTAPEREGRQQTTDSAGRFAFRGVDFQSHYIKVGGDGYVSASRGRVRFPQIADLYSSYEVRVGPKMDDIELYLAPAAKIQGRVTSEAGQPMKNALLTLYTGVVQDGRTMWRRGKVLATDGNGYYTFPNLEPGAYVVMSTWMFDNDPDPPHGTDCGTMSFTPTGGYPPAANPGVLDFTQAQPVHVAAGHVATANLRLPHQDFQTVTWVHNAQLAPGSFRNLVDRNGRSLKIVSPPQSHCGRSMPETVIAGPASPPNNILVNGRETIHLPDGDYNVFTGTGLAKNDAGRQYARPKPGYFAHFTVAGKPVTFSPPLLPMRTVPSVAVHTKINMRPDGIPCAATTTSAYTPVTYDDGKPSWHTIWLTRADPLPEYTKPSSLMLSTESKWVFFSLQPGKYWVHAVEPDDYYGPGAADQANTYIASVTAGGVDMAKEPLVVGLDGTAPPIEVTARNHCGVLQMTYAPANPNQNRYGVVRTFYGLLVPQFSAFETIRSFLFEPGLPQTISVGNLTPGHYKFYVSPHERDFPFRESNSVPADLGPGQDVWLKPGANVDVTVVEPHE